MAVAFLGNVHVKDIELVAYEVSKVFIDKGYICNVKREKETFVTYILKERFLKEFVGTPSALKCSFKQEKNGITIEIKETSVKMNGKNVVKEILGIVTILPLISKVGDLVKLKKEAKKACLFAVSKYKEE